MKDEEWENLKLHIMDIENELDTSARVVTELSRRLVNIETTLSAVLADLYPHMFQHCQYCNAVAEKSLLEAHEKECARNPDNVIH